MLHTDLSWRSSPLAFLVLFLLSASPGCKETLTETVSLVVRPTAVKVAPGETFLFSGECPGASLARWSVVEGGGDVDGSGRYTPPDDAAAGGEATIRAECVDGAEIGSEETASEARVVFTSQREAMTRRVLASSDLAAPRRIAANSSTLLLLDDVAGLVLAAMPEKEGSGGSELDIKGRSAPPEGEVYSAVDSFSGKACLSTDAGRVRIFDVSSPTNPAFQGELEEPLDNPVADVAMVIEHCLAVEESGPVRVIKVEDPEAPASWAYSDDTPAGASGVQMEGSWTTFVSGSEEIRSFDLSDPAHSRFQLYHTFEIPSAPGAFRRAAPWGGHLAMISDTTLSVYNHGDPASPFFEGSLTLPGDLLAVVREDERWAYVLSDEDGSGATRLSLVDLSDPTAPILERRVSLSGAGKDLIVSGGGVFVILSGGVEAVWFPEAARDAADP